MGGSPSSRGEEQLEFPSSGCEQGIGGGCGTGGHLFVYGLQEGKQAHKGAYVYHSFVEGDVGEVVGLKIFSELDLVNAYHQVNLDEDSYLLTGFIIPGSGAACWRVLFFGPKGAVTHFQKEQVVGEVSIDKSVIYVDNILVGSKDVESHVKELNMVIHALTK